mgnify:FL=1
MTTEVSNADLQSLLISKANQILNLEIAVTRLGRELAETTEAQATACDCDTGCCKEED